MWTAQRLQKGIQPVKSIQLSWISPTRMKGSCSLHDLVIRLASFSIDLGDASWTDEYLQSSSSPTLTSSLALGDANSSTSIPLPLPLPPPLSPSSSERRHDSTLPTGTLEPLQSPSLCPTNPPLTQPPPVTTRITTTSPPPSLSSKLPHRLHSHCALWLLRSLTPSKI